MSPVICYVSHVTFLCVLLLFIYFFVDKVFELAGGGSVINGLTPFSFSFDLFFAGQIGSELPDWSGQPNHAL